MSDLVLITLATASIVNTVHQGTVFESFRQWLLRRERAPGALGVTRWAISGMKCAYCFCYWVAAPLTLIVAPHQWSSVALYFAAAWLANHSMAIYVTLLDVLPFMRSRAKP